MRDLESSVVKMTPDTLTMQSETVLTQYIIMNWTLAYNNISKTEIIELGITLVASTDNL